MRLDAQEIFNKMKYIAAIYYQEWASLMSKAGLIKRIKSFLSEKTGIHLISF